MSLLAPGLGQIYNGDARRAGVFAAFYIFWAVIMMTDLAGSPVGFAVFVLLAAAVYFAAIVEAFWSARRRAAIPLSSLNRWFVYLAYVVLLFGIDTLTGPYRGVRVFSMPSGNNLPTIRIGEYVVTKGGGLRSVTPEAGDLVVFVVPGSDETRYMKRVVAQAGARVQMKEGRLYIDGAAVPRERIADFSMRMTDAKAHDVPQYRETLPDGRQYRIIENDGDVGALDNTFPETVPEGHVFVLGDNRDNAFDSREQIHVGMVPLSAIKRKAGFVLWSKDWDRIGTRLD
ncbi:MAG: signal peptidase I [Alphaproteobacteria bacterium]|nr:signal peptidase I [Alphaproteobacteria bacterium]